MKILKEIFRLILKYFIPILLVSGALIGTMYIGYKYIWNGIVFNINKAFTVLLIGIVLEVIAIKLSNMYLKFLKRNRIIWGGQYYGLW